jgi:hypothetical protein
MKIIGLFAICFCVISCYPKIKIDGFDQEEWEKDVTCEKDRIALAKTLIQNQDQILGKGQAEIKDLLGQPNEHELYNRNQKFFFYNLTTLDSCEELKIHYRLSVKFDAIDRAKGLMIEQ